jgi:hypothetical protein
MHELEGEKQPRRSRAAVDLRPLGSIAAMAKGDPNNMEHHPIVSGSLMDFYSLGR